MTLVEDTLEFSLKGVVIPDEVEAGSSRQVIERRVDWWSA